MCCKTSVTTCISDPCLVWLGWLVKGAWEQLRLQLTGDVNCAFEEEVKLCSTLSHAVVQPVLLIASLEQSDLPGYYLVSNLLYSNKIVEWAVKTCCACTYPSLKSWTVFSRGSGLVVVWRVLAAQTNDLLQTHR